MPVFVEADLGELPGRPRDRSSSGRASCSAGRGSGRTRSTSSRPAASSSSRGCPAGARSSWRASAQGDVVGELALLDGGARTATVRALEPTRVLRLGAGRVPRARRPARRGRARAAAAADRARLPAAARASPRARRLAARAAAPVRTARRASRPSSPALEYLRRLPFFRGFEPESAGRRARARARGACIARSDGARRRGRAAARARVTLNGAVEEAIRRGGSAIRVALAGPGRGFGYAGAARRRRGDRNGGRARALGRARRRARRRRRAARDDAFAAAIERDVVAAIRQAERPQARLAAGASVKHRCKRHARRVKPDQAPLGPPLRRARRLASARPTPSTRPLARPPGQSERGNLTLRLLSSLIMGVLGAGLLAAAGVAVHARARARRDGRRRRTAAARCGSTRGTTSTTSTRRCRTSRTRSSCRTRRS